MVDKIIHMVQKIRTFAKTIVRHLPRPLRVSIVRAYEKIGELHTKKHYIYKNARTHKTGPTKNILIYHPSGLSFGGTEKFLQIIAKYLNKDMYHVYYMYSNKQDTRYGHNDVCGRKPYLLHTGVEFIDFTYDVKEDFYPYVYTKTTPSLYEVILHKKIDLIITAGSGYSEFPFNIVHDIPIIMCNIFGSPSTQHNIIKHICISKEVQKKIDYIVPAHKSEIIYIPSEQPAKDDEKISAIRTRFNIKRDDFVFGRIGRASDAIFDPIAIRAFQTIVKKFPHCHYIIMSSPPILKKIVADEHIPNVHFLEASSDENDIWAFHNSIDVLAHFRNDGESCGLNIIESMMCGNPILTHTSHIWNAHLEYLQPEFSRIAEKDNVDQYAAHMAEMVECDVAHMQSMRTACSAYAHSIFLPNVAVNKIEDIIKQYDRTRN